MSVEKCIKKEDKVVAHLPSYVAFLPNLRAE
jgi:hypothetical protein